jgi:hypothetical protein
MSFSIKAPAAGVLVVITSTPCRLDGTLTFLHKKMCGRGEKKFSGHGPKPVDSTFLPTWNRRKPAGLTFIKGAGGVSRHAADLSSE